MTSRDNQASYYDLELPDGTRTEVWSVLRAALTPEEALGYVKGCIATRIMRDGKKPDVDRLREAEKVSIEAGMLREAMEAYLATPDPVAPNAVGVDGPTRAADKADLMAATEAAQRFIDDAWKERLVQIRPDGYLRWVPDNARIAELERELDEAQADHARAQVHINELCLEPARLRSQAAQAERERDKWKERARMTERERDEARETLSRHASAHERHITALARDRDAYCELHAKARAKLNVMTDRYRPRLQVEEPAPRDEVVHVWDTRVNRWMTWPGERVPDDATWTHQPPAPGEGEA